MAVRGRTLALAVALCLAAAGAAVDAQFGNLLKKNLPKPPGAAAPSAPLYCAGITNTDLDQLLKALEIEPRVRAEGDAEARGHEARAQAIEATAQQTAADHMSAVTARQEACQQAAMDKDPRYKEANRLGELRNKAQDRGDEATADKLGEQFAALIEAVEKDAQLKCLDPACLARARTESQLQQQLAELRAAAAKASDSQQKSMFESQAAAYLGMIESEAMMKCATGAGGQMLTAAEQSETDAARSAARSAREGAGAKAARGAGLDEGKYNKLCECVCGGVNNPSGTPLSQDSKDVIASRRDALAAALTKAGKC